MNLDNLDKDTSTRKWHITLNNPLDHGFDHENIIETLHLFAPSYFCLCDEISTTGTVHTHIFMSSSSAVRFGTVKKRFPSAHIEKAYGTPRQNRTYIQKGGKWEDTEKASTVIPDTFYEWGEIPPEKEEKPSRMAQLVQDVQAGLSTVEIIEKDPSMAFRVREIELLRQTLLAEKYSSENRKLEVTYLYGASGTGKTRSIFAAHNPRDICRITNYRAGKGITFDGYSGQDILVFEEFNSQISLEEMLNYLDIYPITLPARYADKVACYTKVYITSNQPLDRQYRAEQTGRPETWKAFLRRIHNISEVTADGTFRILKKNGELINEQE